MASTKWFRHRWRNQHWLTILLYFHSSLINLVYLVVCSRALMYITGAYFRAYHNDHNSGTGHTPSFFGLALWILQQACWILSESLLLLSSWGGITVDSFPQWKPELDLIICFEGKKFWAATQSSSQSCTCFLSISSLNTFTAQCKCFGLVAGCN